MVSQGNSAITLTNLYSCNQILSKIQSSHYRNVATDSREPEGIREAHFRSHWSKLLRYSTPRPWQMNTQYEAWNTLEIIPGYGKPKYTDTLPCTKTLVQTRNSAVICRWPTVCVMTQPIIDVFVRTFLRIESQ
jgi:hypothetical protein